MKISDMNGKDIRRLAEKVNVSYSYLTMIRAGIRRPGPELAKKIEEATSGIITRFSLLYPDEHD